ncbi:MAG: SRPBCC family protein [Propionibacteriaceae bacterium]
MALRIEASVVVRASRDAVWAELIDWEGQRRWIPSTTVTVSTPHRTGLGVRVRAFSGLQVGPLPLGLVDNFVTTGWNERHEVEVLHLGPVFTGVGVFRLTDEVLDGRPGTRFTVIEDAVLPVAVLEQVARPFGRLLDAGLQLSLRRFARLVGSSSTSTGPAPTA